MASCFRRATYRVNILIGVTSNSLLIGTNLLSTGVGPNVVNKDLLPPAWREPVKTIQSPQLRTATCIAVDKEGIVSLFIIIGDLRVRARWRLSKMSSKTYSPEHFYRPMHMQQVPDLTKSCPSAFEIVANLLNNSAIN